MLPSFLLISITCGYRLNIRSRAQLLPLPGQPVRHSAGAVPPGFDAPSSLAVTYFAHRAQHIRTPQGTPPLLFVLS